MLNISAAALPPNITSDEVIRLVYLGLSLEKPDGKAAVLGQIGEAAVRQIYEKRYLVENVTKQGRAGDLFLRRIADPTRPVPDAILAEIKNYTAVVGAAEVEKFYRDLTANSSIIGGIFISLNTKISGIPAFHFTRRGDIPVVFICLEGLASTSEQILFMAADLLWAYTDSKCIDEHVFQKLSSKIAKLSDCLNSLSLSRMFINETRAMLDKQFSKIYETVLCTELQMRQIITSINKTVGGAVVITENQLSIPNVDLTPLQTIIKTKFPGTLATDEEQWELLSKILTEYFNETHFPNYATPLDIVAGKKDISIVYRGPETDPQTLLVLTLMKSKTTISFVMSWVPDTPIAIPSHAAYNNGVVTFTLDTTGVLESILEFIDVLEQQEMMVLIGYV